MRDVSLDSAAVVSDIINLNDYENWSNVAQVVYKRTYARKDNGHMENWSETVKRAIAGNTRNHNVRGKARGGRG